MIARHNKHHHARQIHTSVWTPFPAYILTNKDLILERPEVLLDGRAIQATISNTDKSLLLHAPAPSMPPQKRPHETTSFGGPWEYRPFKTPLQAASSWEISQPRSQNSHPLPTFQTSNSTTTINHIFSTHDPIDSFSNMQHTNFPPDSTDHNLISITLSILPQCSHRKRILETQHIHPQQPNLPDPTQNNTQQSITLNKTNNNGISSSRRYDVSVNVSVVSAKKLTRKKTKKLQKRRVHLIREKQDPAKSEDRYRSPSDSSFSRTPRAWRSKHCTM
ncbi:hypothetical protein EDD21DRAFT_198052 [Dissophora ornata]|nr:hypothetical protein EDD21DRAFT_198052 [Dissophora ornata]